MFTAEPIRAFSDNYLWLLSCPGSAAAAIVDPGDAGPVLRTLRRRNAVLGAILITHHHADHIGGVRRLVSEFPGIPVFGPEDSRIGDVTELVSEGDEITVDCLDCRFRVIEVAGHTSSHIAYYGQGKLFCGDTVFACGCGRLFEGTPQQMHRSLSKIMSLPDDTEIYCAHEYTLDNIAFAKQVEPQNPVLLERERIEKAKRRRDVPTVPSLLSLEKQTNPFLRFSEAAVVAAAERFAGRSLPHPAEVFGAIRHWKDTGFD